MFDIGILSLKEAYDMRVQLNNLIEKYENDARKVLAKGEKHPDFTLKQGNKKRTWTDPEKLTEVLRDAGYTNKDIYDVKMKGIPAIEKLTKDTTIDLDPFIEESRQKDVMVYTGSKA